MRNGAVSSNLMNLLNEALLREIHVSIQYMLQHSVENGRRSAIEDKKQFTKQSNFIASHSNIWFPGSTLKKIAITEMRHAEAIAERIVVLSGEPVKNPGAITIGLTTKEMLEIDREEEREAIKLYKKIIAIANQEKDDLTKNMFRRILSDEEKHYNEFSKLLE
jgi:bacterioferritin